MYPFGAAVCFVDVEADIALSLLHRTMMAVAVVVVVTVVGADILAVAM